MDFKNRELLTELILKSELPDIVHLCQVNSFAADICRSEEIWSLKTIEEYPQFLSAKSPSSTWKQFYYDIYNNHIRPVPIYCGETNDLGDIYVRDTDTFATVSDRCLVLLRQFNNINQPKMLKFTVRGNALINNEEVTFVIFSEEHDSHEVFSSPKRLKEHSPRINTGMGRNLNSIDSPLLWANRAKGKEYDIDFWNESFTLFIDDICYSDDSWVVLPNKPTHTDARYSYSNPRSLLFYSNPQGFIKQPNL